MNKDVELVRGTGNPFADTDDRAAVSQTLKAMVMTEILRILRERNLTAVDAAEMTGVGRSQISRIRNGRISGISTDTLVNVLDALTRAVTPEKRLAINIRIEERDAATP